MTHFEKKGMSMKIESNFEEGGQVTYWKCTIE